MDDHMQELLERFMNPPEERTHEYGSYIIEAMETNQLIAEN